MSLTIYCNEVGLLHVYYINMYKSILPWGKWYYVMVKAVGHGVEPLDETAVFCYLVDPSMSHIYQHTGTITLNPLTTDLVILLRGFVTLPCKYTKTWEKKEVC